MNVKYPKTFHLPWSPGISRDDRVLSNYTVNDWEGKEVVITEKMDGENTTLYSDYIHARSLDYTHHWSREWMKALHARLRNNIPEGYRICGENLTAKHSIGYSNLSSIFQVFNIWAGNTCLSWADTFEWCKLIGEAAEVELVTVPVLYWGAFNRQLCETLCDQLNPETQEGLVVRPAAQFDMKDFSSVVGKYVRAHHVQTDEHWMRQTVGNGVRK